LAKYPQTSTLLSELEALTPPVPIHHSIDATKLSTYRALRSTGPYDFIIFNFPHTGGLSTDVNRQVRANQALLVKFFTEIVNSCKEAEESEHTEHEKGGKKALPPLLSPTGKVIVTLFTSHPYTLWNIRDLARHCGLKVAESFKFDWELYPGYSHVRTLGTLEGEAAWKGEEREARSYIFERPGAEGGGNAARKKKRKRGEESDTEESDEE
jgi:25S rRNA (uracil2634-N3)-methyltransferase